MSKIQTIIDTVKELVVLSNIDKGALGEIETYITEYMMEEKKKIDWKKIGLRLLYPHIAVIICLLPISVAPSASCTPL